MFEKLLPYDTAFVILEAYVRYFCEFKKITKRAKIRFEHRDWSGIQSDMKERALLYRNWVGQTTEDVRDSLDLKLANRTEFWIEVKQRYFEEIRNFNTRNVAETFYNSVFRHLNPGLSANPETMFVHATGSYREFKSVYPIYHTFDFTTSVPTTIERMLSLYPFEAPFENLARDVRYISKTLEAKLNSLNVHWKYARVELLKSVFYRNKGAYLVGRLFVHDSSLPFVLPLLHQRKGIFADSLLLDQNDVSSIFSYHRSYFLVDVDIVIEAVDFLKSILPTKRFGEIYSSIGFEKHGKTVFYRDFQRHLIRSDDQFATAPGIKGMVMVVFTLPSYNMVFKVIKDRFEAPKNITEEEVKEKYHLVSRHDRVGRMTDSHMFEHLVFDVRRFSEELLADLREHTASRISIKGNQLTINHLYVEKRMTPLNLYLETASDEERRDAIDEYGKAIKELASVNIFPGDLLLKNFGVTRLKRVVFYDYDEIGFLTEYHFREIPEPRDDYEAFSAEPYFHVGPQDIFPEEFVQFLFPKREWKAVFRELHGDLYGIDFWRGTQRKIKRGSSIDFYPYDESLRFRNRYGRRKKRSPKPKS
ncbi:MAG: bifunctional isocitrate dehydrogenase kinase/phosphatase [Bacteroidota bacterium]